MYHLFMRDLDSISKELSELPKGYISKKQIKGKTYFYWQYFSDGKLKSVYIPFSKVEETKALLERRKDLEKQIEAMQKSNNSFNVPSERAKRFTGCLMSGDKVAAKFNEGVLICFDERICPLYIKRTKDIQKFLENRCIDLSRPNARVLLKFLKIYNKCQSLIPLYSYGACISDNYWFKPSGSKKKYKDISFNSDYLHDLALNGGIPQFKHFGSFSPELTNIGSFEKCWKLIDGEWWLFKKGNEDQIFSELFTAKLSQFLGLTTAIYEYDDGNIKTKNFAYDYNFEPMYALCDDNEDYEMVFGALLKFGKKIAQDFLKLLFCDCLVFNVDRHNNNYGILRNKDNGEIISLAPNFDNNLSLLAYNKTLDQDPKSDGLIKIFVDFLKESNEAMILFKKSKINQINENDIRKIIKGIPIKKDEEKIIDFVLRRYEFLMEIKNS